MTETTVVHAAGDTDPRPGPAGRKPYEMTEWVEARTPRFHFDKVTGWVGGGARCGRAAVPHSRERDELPVLVPR